MVDWVKNFLEKIHVLSVLRAVNFIVIKVTFVLFFSVTITYTKSNPTS